MIHSSAPYERELKELLQGDPEALRQYARSLDPESRRIVESFRHAPFLVVRAAGSLGFDLVALRREFAFPLEVKVSMGETIHFSAASGRAAEQLDAHERAVRRVGLVVLYAFRKMGHRSGDPWRIFAGAASAGKGTLDLLRRRLPAMDRTRNGNAVLRWTDGMPLVEFLRLVLYLTDTGPESPS